MNGIYLLLSNINLLKQPLQELKISEVHWNCLYAALY